MTDSALQKIKCATVVLVTLISSHGLAKSQIISEFELLLPRQFQQTLIDKKWQSLATEEFSGKWPFPDQQVVSRNIPVKIKDIFLNIKTKVMIKFKASFKIYVIKKPSSKIPEGLTII